MNFFHRSIARIFSFALLTFAIWLPWAPGGLAQQDDILFRRSRDPKIIRGQIRAALPSLERGYALLISSTDPESTATAVNLLHETYRYLRAAQESSEVLESISKFPDPLVGLQNRQLGEIRDRLLGCWSNRTHLAEPGLIRTNCVDGLGPSLRKLRVIVASLPG
jgi:hypothetical protein